MLARYCSRQELSEQNINTTRIKLRYEQKRLYENKRFLLAKEVIIRTNNTQNSRKSSPVILQTRESYP